jgi:hypothetical protein
MCLRGEMGGSKKVCERKSPDRSLADDFEMGNCGVVYGVTRFRIQNDRIQCCPTSYMSPAIDPD